MKVSHRRLNAVCHRAVEQFAALFFDQLHDALLDAHQVQEAVVRLADHIHDGVADADNLILTHRFFSSNMQRSRIKQVPQRGFRALQVYRPCNIIQ